MSSRRTAMDGQINAHEIVSYVNEFYSTVDQERRQQLDRILCQFKHGEFHELNIFALFVFKCFLVKKLSQCAFKWWIVATVRMFSTLELFRFTKRFGKDLKDALLIRHWYLLLPYFFNHAVQMENLKTFLVNNLTVSSRVQMQSVTNKVIPDYYFFIYFFNSSYRLLWLS